MAHVLTLISSPANPQVKDYFAKDVAKAVDSPRSITWLDPDIACDIALPDGCDPWMVETSARSIFAHLAVDVAVVDTQNRRKQIFLADMDSTIIQQECIDELADEAGSGAKVAAITIRAMNGEIEFDAALRERVALLKGLNTSVIDGVIDKRITLASGARQLLATLKKHNVYCSLVSGGFTHFTKSIAAMLNFDEHRANSLEERNGILTGRVIDPILGKEAKLQRLHEICRQQDLKAENTIAVGDGANDLAMLEGAGMGIALHAKPVVAAAAKIRIDHADLTGLLYLQGYNRNEFAD